MPKLDLATAAATLADGTLNVTDPGLTDQFTVSDANAPVLLIDSSGTSGADVMAYATLSAAITAADAVAANQGAITIDLQANETEAADPEAVNLAGGNNLVIDGDGYSLNGADGHRGLFVYAGRVTVENLTIRDTAAVGGAGGAGGAGLGGGLFVASTGDVTLSGVAFQNDAATGGQGGAGSLGGDGGGGGLGGAGGGAKIGGGGGGGIGGGARGGSSSSHAGSPGIVAGAGNASGGGGGFSTSGGGGGIGPSGASGGFGGLAAAHCGQSDGGFGGGGGFGAGGFGGGGGGGGSAPDPAPAAVRAGRGRRRVCPGGRLAQHPRRRARRRHRHRRCGFGRQQRPGLSQRPAGSVGDTANPGVGTGKLGAGALLVGSAADPGTVVLDPTGGPNTYIGGTTLAAPATASRSTACWWPPPT